MLYKTLPFIVAASIALMPGIAASTPYPVHDASYGGNPDGIVRVAFDLVGNKYDAANSAVVLPGGSLLMAGQALTNAGLSQSDFAFARVDAGGVLDTTFGTSNDGLVVAGLAPTNSVAQIRRTADGHFVYVGMTTSGSGVIARIDADGSPDTTFNLNGHRFFGAGFFIDAGTTLFLTGIESLPGGKILAAGYAGSATQVCAVAVRLNADGSTDTTFGAGRGSVCYSPASSGTPAAGAFGLALQPDGRILLPGTGMHPGGSGFDMSVLRLMSDGSIDTSFGPAHDGWAFVGFDAGGTLHDSANAATVDANGRVLLAGDVETQNAYDMGVARLMPNGDLDTSFGSGGRVETSFDLSGWNIAFANDVIVLPDRHILVGGMAQANSTVGTAIMLKPNGQFEYHFGDAGKFMQTDPAGAESTILTSQHMVVSGDYMYMVGSIISPVLIPPNGDRNYDFGATRYMLPLFADDFEDGTVPPDRDAE
jgi:uncharacterized delta-60 repeat protein